MMERYLLFDSGCLVCSGLAQEIEQVAGGWLAVRSLRSAEIQAQLDQAAPNWRWEPLLLETDGQNARVYRGLGMRMHILAGIGVRRATHVARLVHQAGLAAHEAHTGRRSFLKGSATVMAGLVLGVIPIAAEARESVGGDLQPLSAGTLAGGERAEALRRQALASRDVSNLLQTHAVTSAAPTIYEYERGAWSATFQAVNGGIITYMVRPKAELRTQAIYERDGAFVAYSMDGILAKTTNLKLGQRADVHAMVEDCTQSGCSFERMQRCTRCCSTCSGYRSTENNCCVCQYPGGGSYVFFCRPYAYGPCGLC